MFPRQTLSMPTCDERRLTTGRGMSPPHARPPRRSAPPLGAAALLALALGCDESGPRIYTAQRHSLDAGCLEAYAPIGLVEAEAVSSQCPLACLRLGEDLYVSSVCPPYPAEASVEADDSEGCAAALAAPSCDDLAEASDAAAP